MQCFSIREHYSKEITPFSGIAFISVKLVGETSNDHDTHTENVPDNSLPQSVWPPDSCKKVGQIMHPDKAQ